MCRAEMLMFQTLAALFVQSVCLLLVGAVVFYFSLAILNRRLAERTEHKTDRRNGFDKESIHFLASSLVVPPDQGCHERSKVRSHQLKTFLRSNRRAGIKRTLTERRV